MPLHPCPSTVRAIAVSAGVCTAVATFVLHAHADILVAWGGDTMGKLGDGEATTAPRATAARVVSLGRVPAGGHGLLGICRLQHRASRRSVDRAEPRAGGRSRKTSSHA